MTKIVRKLMRLTAEACFTEEERASLKVSKEFHDRFIGVCQIAAGSGNTSAALGQGFLGHGRAVPSTVRLMLFRLLEDDGFENIKIACDRKGLSASVTWPSPKKDDYV